MTNYPDEDPLLNEVQQLLRETDGLNMNAKVSDFMRPHPLVLKSDATLKDAIRIIIENKIDGVPIVSDEGKIVGLITKTMALREINHSGDIEKNIGDIMKTDPLVTKPNEDISKLITINVGSLPVVEDGRVVGIVTLSDTIRAYFSSILNFEEELHTVINSAYNGIITIDLNGHIKLMNDAAEKILSIARKAALNRLLSDILPDAKLDDIVHTGRSDFGQKLIFKDKILVTNKSPLRHKDKIIGAVAVFQDISDLEHISEELTTTKELKEELVTIIESSFDGIYLTDNQGRVLRVNDAFTRITGIQKNELLGYKMEDLVVRGIFKQSIPLQAMLEGKPVTIAQEVRSGKTILVTSNPIMDGSGNVFRVVHNARDITELNELKNQLEKAESLSDHYKEQLNRIKISGKYIAKSKKSKELVELVMRLSKVDTTILILGESGVGKEIVAEMLHENSLRRDKPMIPINCAAIPDNLLESELFGYEAGAFTGAHKKGRAGIFELANGGTIFLDEIGEMPLHLQSKLLRTIQQKVITRLGGNKPLKVDVRIIAASNKNLADMAAKNEFRQDLFYRLNVVPVNIPPLRDRREEVPNFVTHFTTLYNKKYKINKRFDERAINLLMSYDWPGNVRELQNVIERNMITCPEDIISNIDLPGHQSEDARKPDEGVKALSGFKLGAAVAELEKEMIRNALIRFGTTRKAAAAIGISQPTFIRKASKHKIKADVV